jgi:hypothetical protein
VEARLTLSRDQFQKDLEAAKADADKFARGDYTATLKADNSAANKAIDDTQARADKFGRSSETAKLKVDNTGANRSIDQTNVKAKSLGKSFAKGLGAAPWWAGPAIASLPAAINLLGVAAGASAALGATFVTGGIALAGYGAITKSVLSQAATAATAVQTAQTAYDSAVDSGTKTAVAYRAEQKAILTAYAQMSPAQIALSRQLGTLSDDWHSVEQSLTPLIATSVRPWLTGISAGMGDVSEVIIPVSGAIRGLGGDFRTLVNDRAFGAFASFVGTEGAATVKAGGGALLDFLHGFMVLLPEFTPLIDDVDGGITRLGTSFLAWTQSQAGRDDVQKFMAWITANGPGAARFLENAGKALVTLGGGLSAGGMSEVRVLGDFFGLIAKLPKSFVAPVADLAATLLIISKFGFGRKLISVAVDWAGQGASALLSLLSGGKIDLAGKFGASAGMQKAGDTMLTASAEMQKAADTMAGASGRAGVAGDAGAAGAAAERDAGAAGKAGIASVLTDPLTWVPAAAVLGAVIAAKAIAHPDTTRPLTARQLAGESPAMAAQQRTGLYMAVNPMDVHTGLNPLTGRQMPPSFVQNAELASPYSRADLEYLVRTYGVTLPQAIKMSEAGGLDLGKNWAGSSAELKTVTASAAQWLGEIGSSSDSLDKGIKAQALYTQATRALAHAFTDGHGAQSQFTTDLTSSSEGSKTAAVLTGEYTLALAHNGAQSAAGQNIRQRLITDFMAQGLNAHQANALVNSYTAGIAANGTTAQAKAAARAALITDLENAGLSARRATADVDGLTTAVGKIPKSDRLSILVAGTGTWNVLKGGTAQARGSGARPVAAQGWRIPGYGGGDIVPVMAEPGETIVPKHLTPAIAPLMAAHGVPGFSAGGVVGSFNGSVPGLASWTKAEWSKSLYAIEQSTAAATSSGLAAAVAAAAAGPGAGMPGPGGGAPAANAALARRLFPAWGSGPEWTAWNNVAMAESGWSTIARNPSSGAYGIPQALPASKMGPAANPPESNPTAQIRWMAAYMRSVYGDPIGAWAHEQSLHWYDQGGPLAPGLTMALNTTGRPETVVPGQSMDDLIAGIDDVAALLESVLAAIRQAPARTGTALGSVLSGAARANVNAGLYS